MTTTARFVFGIATGFGIAQILAWSQRPIEAQTTPKCDYTFIQDGGEPNIGKEGVVKYNESWAKVVNDGWVLKVGIGGGGNAVYVFEKCRS